MRNPLLQRTLTAPTAISTSSTLSALSAATHTLRHHHFCYLAALALLRVFQILQASIVCPTQFRPHRAQRFVRHPPPPTSPLTPPFAYTVPIASLILQYITSPRYQRFALHFTLSPPFLLLCHCLHLADLTALSSFFFQIYTSFRLHRFQRPPPASPPSALRLHCPSHFHHPHGPWFSSLLEVFTGFQYVPKPPSSVHSALCSSTLCCHHPILRPSLTDCTPLAGQGRAGQGRAGQGRGRPCCLWFRFSNL